MSPFFIKHPIIAAVISIVTTMLGIISMLTVTDRAHNTEGFGPIRADFMKLYEEKLGSVMCNDLKPKYRTEENGCLKTCELTAELLAEYLTEKGLVK